MKNDRNGTPGARGQDDSTETEISVMSLTEQEDDENKDRMGGVQDSQLGTDVTTGAGLSQPTTGSFGLDTPRVRQGSQALSDEAMHAGANLSPPSKGKMGERQRVGGDIAEDDGSMNRKMGTGATDVDEASRESFPASDPPAFAAGEARMDQEDTKKKQSEKPGSCCGCS